MIEAKNWKNWVRGDYGDKHWKGQGASRGVITTFNPIDQNFIHIRALRNAIRRECREENCSIIFLHSKYFPDKQLVHQTLLSFPETVDFLSLLSKVFW